MHFIEQEKESHMEYFDIVDEQGNPTGQTVERKQAHRNNILHRTAHVWIVRRRGNSIQILLQKRCMEKDSFPGCYDISSAGHIPAGVDYIPSALRELREELGLTIEPKQLIDCGLHRHHADEVFHGERFLDNQISKVFLLWLDVDEADITVQKEEIDSVKWFDYAECKQDVINGTIPNCIDVAELEMLELHFIE